MLGSGLRRLGTGSHLFLLASSSILSQSLLFPDSVFPSVQWELRNLPGRHEVSSKEELSCAVVFDNDTVLFYAHKFNFPITTNVYPQLHFSLSALWMRLWDLNSVLSRVRNK